MFNYGAARLCAIMCAISPTIGLPNLLAGEISLNYATTILRREVSEIAR